MIGTPIKHAATEQHMTVVQVKGGRVLCEWEEERAGKWVRMGKWFKAHELVPVEDHPAFCSGRKPTSPRVAAFFFKGTKTGGR